MRLSSMVALVLAILPVQAQADLIGPGQRPPRPPPPEAEERWKASVAIRDAGHDCAEIQGLDRPALEDAPVVGRKDYRAWRVRCSNGRTFLVGLPYDWTGERPSDKVVVKPLP
jgi:hypothetical protein